jgi:hypothetical protein
MTLYGAPVPDTGTVRLGSTGRALAGGAAVAAAGSVVWAVVGYLTKHQYSLTALLIGFGVGYVVRRWRRGYPAAAAAAAVLALLGCALGTLLALAAIMGHWSGIAQAYPRSTGSLGIVFWLMAAVAAFTYPMAVHGSRPRQPRQDGQVLRATERPAWALRPAPGGYGTPQAPSGHDDGEPQVPWEEPVPAEPAAAWVPQGCAVLPQRRRPAGRHSRPSGPGA